MVSLAARPCRAAATRGQPFVPLPADSCAAYPAAPHHVFAQEVRSVSRKNDRLSLPDRDRKRPRDFRSVSLKIRDGYGQRSPGEIGDRGGQLQLPAVVGEGPEPGRQILAGGYAV